MAEEKKKMSVAEILAAARKQKAEAAESAAPAAIPVEPEAAAPVPAESAASTAATGEVAPAAKPIAKAAGERPNVKDILALARAKKAEGAAPAAPAAKPIAKPVGEAKPAAKAAVKPAAAAGPAPAKDTASILAAARKAAKPGPVTKEEAAAKEKTSPAAPVKAKAPLFVPPMPAKPEAAKPKPKAASASDGRRSFLGMVIGSALGLGMTALSATAGLWTLGTARFMFPNVLTEPPSRFKVGPPANFAPGQVETKFVAERGVWVVNYEYQGKPQLYALRTVCTHLGCTPNWLEAEQKFKCPCHGSGFYKDGINFEGPAPRPLERFAIHIADDGQVEIDKSKTFQEEMGGWADPASYIAV
ncbi:MAG TPA: Rieske 2Fe-2S domain-containing protein [Pirellulales bacterium]|jgi:cytochrome b6-f complex iron-sulfur subunit|nr:Rieske 2Fe-2S domain-containing protein [Pirellulales bacterium]